MNNGKNRQRLAAAAALAFGVLVLAVPEAAARGFAGGTALCLQSVLPALFPFFVVCELLTAAPPPAVLLRPMQQVLGLESAETARALLLSWVGGYAVCARLAGQLYGAGRITRRDAALLQVLGCCSGPGFVIGCVGGALLGNVRLGVVLYAAQIGANLGAGAVCQLLSHIVGMNTVRPLAVSGGGGLSGKAQPHQLDGRTMFAPTDCTREVSGRSKVLSPTRCGGSLLAEGAEKFLHLYKEKPMSDHPKISIISTVYNTGPYLRPAVESILAQTFTDFELLLVDDGSHDGSAAVCDALAQEDARIRVFHQPNGGPAHARNTGLDNARGDYIGMVDSDDLIEPTMFATLYSAVQVDGVRLAACAGDCIDADGKKIEGRMVTIRQGGVRDAQELLLEAFQTGSFYGPLSWNKLFDARLFKEKGIHYDETMLFGDDASVLHRVFEGERCNCLTDVLYHYRTRAGQITTAGFPPRKTDDLRMYWEWLQYFSARPGREEYYDWAVVRYWKIFYQFWCQSDAAGNLPEVRPKFMAHKKHLDAILPDILASKYLPLGEKLRAAAFCASPTLTYGAAAAWGRLHTRKGK